MAKLSWCVVVIVGCLAGYVYRYIQNEHITPLAQYDFIIVGGGTAGVVLANRLSANPNYTVLLLEAGVNAADGSLWMNIPLASPLNFLSRSLYWADLSEAQPSAGGSCKGHRVAHPHGKILGGSSSVNMMIYTRGSPSDYDLWESNGAYNWSWRHVEPYFRAMEQAHGIPRAEGMGTAGPMHVTQESSFHTISQYILNASEELGVKVNSNYNGETMFGTGLVQSMAYNGTRWSPVSAYLSPALERKNLQVITQAYVTKVLTTNLTAVGVKFTRHGEEFQVLTRHEVILSAGAYNSPHLLMLSGIGPKKHLEEHEIKVVADVPGVGENLHDHAAVSENLFIDKLPGVSLSTRDLTLANVWEYVTHGTGLLAENMFTALTFLSANETKWLTTNQSKDQQAPDIQIMYAVMPLGGGINDWGLSSYVYDFLNLNDYALERYYNNLERSFGTSLVIAIANPQSRGTVRLRTNDPKDRPLLQANLLSHPQDRVIMKQALKFVHSLAHTRTLSAIGSYLLDEAYPQRDRACSQFTPYSDEHLDCFISFNSGSAFHGVGSCKMGTDAMAVVDPQLRVHGVKSLRVVDASVIPTIISANTQAPTLMIAERAAEFILSAAAAHETPAEIESETKYCHHDSSSCGKKGN